MKKKLIGMVLTLALLISALAAVPMTVQADSMMVVTVGADLTEEQKNMILKYFNVSGQSYQTITVNNDDEWSHLGSYMSRDIVGYRTISCALIRPMTSGGIQVKTANLTYVTSNMIASNLATAGVTNCEVLAAAPFQVSGTGALTGALMAYENLSGVTLSQTKKDLAAQEFATTYDLGQTIGQQQAQQIVNDMKMQVINGTMVEDNSISQDEITEIVNNVVNNYSTVNNNGLTADDIAALQELAVKIAQESYEKGTLDALAQIQETLEGQTQTSSTPQTSKIEEEAAPTSDNKADSSDQNVSAADQALADDSLLNQTDESALAGTTDNGSVISSSTAESTIDSSVATNLDEQIEQQNQEQAPQAQNDVQSDDTGIPEATDSTVIPEPTDVTTLDPASDAVDVIDDTPDDAFDAPVDAADDDIIMDIPQDDAADVQDDFFQEEAQPEESKETPLEEGPAMVRDSAITADDVRSGNAQLVSYNVTSDDGAQTQGTAPIALVLPYNDLVPVSGTLHVTAGSGAEVAVLDISSDSSDILTVNDDPSVSIPGGWEGYTKFVMTPRELNSGSAFTATEGENYAFTLDAQFAQTSDPFATDGAPVLNVQIDNYAPYGGSVSGTGFSVSSYSLSNASYMNGAQGSVLFPSDGSAQYAVVSADNADVSVDSGAYGVSAGSGDTVSIYPYQSGKTTLTITYYAAAPEEGMDVDPSMQVAQADCSIQFTD